MTALRRLLLRHPAGAIALLLATLAIRLLVPQGYMPDTGAGRLTLTLCSGMGPMAGMAGMARHGHDPAKPAPDAPCGFGGLTTGGTGGAIAAPEAPSASFALPRPSRIAGAAPVAAPRRLRPPLRAPPVPLLAA